MTFTKTGEMLRLENEVDGFASGMKRKLYQKAVEGVRGFDDEKNLRDITLRFKRASERLLAGDMNQAVDVANLAMFLKIHDRVSLLGKAGKEKREQATDPQEA